ncbi:hypothetical protein K505DRAFT_382496 [Melanomma pulvis-pyrius CBS 109.77]|uniref:Uncharacterized protein n=1 Tax=Melanomma pulvis-pyrius CBS 109.77 TaxID=1314802 RepID=A0A6A6XFS4_9PLEO|nr:hypothetical protein K505DRAFT_382496 [Melanomma pulvis-pyrius CBS 109.77]
MPPKSKLLKMGKPKSFPKGIPRGIRPPKSANNHGVVPTKDGVTPAKNGNPPKQTLMLKPARGGNGPKTSSGRPVKVTQDPQAATSEELNRYLQDAADSAKSSCKSSTPFTKERPLSTLLASPVPAVAPAVAPATLDTPCSTKAQGPSPWPEPDPWYTHSSGNFPADIDSSVYQLAEILQTQDEVQTELPDLENDTDPDGVTPWSAKQLVHLYILCYHNGEYNSCDLIADTWIRALQKQNSKSNGKMWKRNPTSGYELVTAHDYDDIDDPRMDHDVPDFDQDRLNELYFHTNKDCGARLLWADAMALAGSNLEEKMEESEAKTDKMWHKDLVWDIMRTSLRLTRAKLTLKIEEKAQGAWCARYHEHGKHEKPCYLQSQPQPQQEAAGLDADGDGDGEPVPPQDTNKRTREAAELDEVESASESGDSDRDEDAEDEPKVVYQPAYKRVKFAAVVEEPEPESEESEESEEE